MTTLLSEVEIRGITMSPLPRGFFMFSLDLRGWCRVRPGGTTTHGLCQHIYASSAPECWPVAVFLMTRRDTALCRRLLPILYLIGSFKLKDQDTRITVADDHNAGVRFDIPQTMPVDDDGHFFKGDGQAIGGLLWYITEANPVIVQ